MCASGFVAFHRHLLLFCVIVLLSVVSKITGMKLAVVTGANKVIFAIAALIIARVDLGTFCASRVLDSRFARNLVVLESRPLSRVETRL
jgi:hypothetical protein